MAQSNIVDLQLMETSLVVWASFCITSLVTSSNSLLLSSISVLISSLGGLLIFSGKSVDLLSISSLWSCSLPQRKSVDLLCQSHHHFCEENWSICWLAKHCQLLQSKCNIDISWSLPLGRLIVVRCPKMVTPVRSPVYSNNMMECITMQTNSCPDTGRKPPHLNHPSAFAIQIPIYSDCNIFLAWWHTHELCLTRMQSNQYLVKHKMASYKHLLLDLPHVHMIYTSFLMGTQWLPWLCNHVGVCEPPTWY